MRLGQPKLQVPTIAGPVNWEVDELTSQQFIRGTYEPYMQQAFAKFIRPGSVVYDVGAHAGYHSLLCGLLTGPSGRVFSFEPHPGHRESIRRQLALNPKLDVTLLAYALSNSCSSLFLNTDSGPSQGRVSDAGRFEIEARSIDYLVKNESLPPPDVVKIDVEGHEEQVLSGALETIRSCRPVILCDHNDPQTFPVVAKLLEPLGYGVSSGALVIGIPNKLSVPEAIAV
jgi:FkbM family methyltransferase